jgi:hypothetical protein
MPELTTADLIEKTTTSSCCSSDAQSAAAAESTPQASGCGCSADQSTATVTQDLERASPVSARQVVLYEPAMCCQTGVCGPSVDQELIDVRESLRWVEGQGAAVTRHNLSSDPDAFVANPKVTGLMAAFGESALPVLVLEELSTEHTWLVAWQSEPPIGASALRQLATDSGRPIPALGA